MPFSLEEQVKSEASTPRSRRAKVIRLKKPAGAIPNEMKEFIDEIIVPALVEKYFAEHDKGEVDR